MANRHVFFADRKPMGSPADNIIVGHRPAIRAGHHIHPVAAQHMQLSRQLVRPRHRLKIGVPGQQQKAIDRLQQLGPSLGRIGLTHQIQQRMQVIPCILILQDQWQGRRRLGDQLHRPKADRIAQKPCLGQRGRIARAPRHPPGRAPGHHAPGGTGFLLYHVGQPRLRRAPQEIKHHPPTP